VGRGQTALNFNAYPNSGGIVTGLPAIAATALGRNAGFGTVTKVGAGALGFSRILQTLIRVQF